LKFSPLRGVSLFAKWTLAYDFSVLISGQADTIADCVLQRRKNAASKERGAGKGTQALALPSTQ